VTCFAYSRNFLSCASARRGVRSATSARSSRCCRAILRTAGTVSGCTHTHTYTHTDRHSLVPSLHACRCPQPPGPRPHEVLKTSLRCRPIGTPALYSRAPEFRAEPRDHLSWFPIFPANEHRSILATLSILLFLGSLPAPLDTVCPEVPTTPTNKSQLEVT
jgi:hypothetical protein